MARLPREQALLSSFVKNGEVVEHVCLRPFTTLKAGGPAEYFFRARSADLLAEMSALVQKEGIQTTHLGSGSNVLPADAGVRGLVILNQARKIQVGADGVLADAGCSFQELFLKTVQAGLRGLEFAVGIPGTLGGALVSNAGAYRSSISEFLTEIEVVFEGKRQWVLPSFMEFSYRDSILRRETPPAIALLRVRMKLPAGNSKSSYDEAREYQRQRISKQPPPASAGSFFKNVTSKTFAETLEDLPKPLKEAGVVPSGFLIERSGLKGTRMGGAMLSSKHANFILNVGGATATDIRNLANLAKRGVRETFGVEIEEEVLYLGDWSSYVPEG